ncbi:MAG: DUF2905 domain-containing protein [Candidatus Saganbacteria bacterium]|nr:DUF2905 domain-containing protein [Candidatus Saganbacteria bacterium]
MAFEGLGKLLVYIGIVIVLIGGFFMLLAKLPWIGKLPGDLVVERQGLKIYIPLTTMIIMSIFLTIFFNLILRR